MAEVFQDSMESDFAAWSETDTGSKLAQSGTAALKGSSGGALLTFDSTTAAYLQATLSGTSTTEYRYEFYLDPNTMAPVNNSDFDFIWLHAGGSLNHKMYLIDVSGVLKLRAELRNDASTPSTGDYTLSGAEQYFEVHVHKATGVSANDAYCYVYADGDFVTPVISLTGIDLWDAWVAADKFRIGAIASINATPSGSFYFDEVTVRNDGTKIGAAPPVFDSNTSDIDDAAIGVAESIGQSVTFTDSTGGNVEADLLCTEALGDLTVTLSGCTVSAGTNGTHTFTIAGTIAQVETALGTLSYTAIAEGDETVTVTLDDTVNTPVSDTIDITIYYMTVVATSQPLLNTALATLTATNASAASETITVLATDSGGRTGTNSAIVDTTNVAPINVLPARYSVLKRTAKSLTGIAAVDADGNITSVKLTVTDGTLNVTLDGSATISAGANDSVTLTISGTQTEINNTLATTTYTPDTDFMGTDVLTMLTTDSGTLTDEDTSSLIVSNLLLRRRRR